MQPLSKKQKIVWPDETEYFLTTSTFLHFPYFKEDTQKKIVLNKIREIEKSLGIKINDYSIAVNHFHLKFYLPKGEVMTKIKTVLHSGISREYRKNYEVPYKDFWQSSRVYYIKDENMSWKVTGYIAGNLLKHKEVSTFEELENNPFSSYGQLIEKYDKEMVKNLIYQVIQIDESAENEIDFGELKDVVMKK